MVNYVLSFCKITGASKIFSRNFYLPLLKPLTPKDALRTLRITGKWLLGAKIQHYIPVLLNHRKKRSRRSKNFGKNRHDAKDNDYAYMTPVIDAENESHKPLLTILDSKPVNGSYVYTVDDKRYNIVLQAQMERAILDGDVIDVLVSQKNDKIIVKLASMKKIPLEIQNFESSEDLFKGEGATSPEEEKDHHHGQYTMGLAKIFEEKEMTEEKWEEELKKIMRRRRKRAKHSTKEWKELMKETTKRLDWKKFEEDAKRVIEEISEPAVEQPIDMEIEDLQTTTKVNETIIGSNLMGQLPTIKEIADVIKSMGSATLHEIEEEGPTEEIRTRRRVSGVKVTLSSGKECFVSGQMVHTEDGDVFVPGQTIDGEFGLEYAPGITINVDNKPTLINGLIMGEEEKEPMFLPTESTITADGLLTFATAPEERPQLEPETMEHLKRQRLMRKQQVSMVEEEEEEGEEEEEKEEEEVQSEFELNNSDMEELDMEAIRQKQEAQRLEIERLKLILLDDGLDDVIASIEAKRAKLQQKLEELRKLSLASAENNLVTYIGDTDTLEIASRITSDADTMNRLSDILMTMTRRAATYRDRNSIIADNINQDCCISLASATESDVRFHGASHQLKVLLKTAAVAANEVFKTRPKDQAMALGAMGDIIVDVLKSDHEILSDLLALTETPKERGEICGSIYKELTQSIADAKVSILHKIANGLPDDEVVERIEKMLKNESSDIKCEAFVKVSKIAPGALKILTNCINAKIATVKTEEDAVDLLQRSIEQASKTIMSNNLASLLEDNGYNASLKDEAMSFAHLLESDPKIIDTLQESRHLGRICHKPTTDLLERVTLIKQLADRDYSLKCALVRLNKNPERARSDPRIRQLVRESAMLIPRGQPIRTSRDIPIQLLKSQNLLAIEDFLMQRIKLGSPVLVSRNSHQAVVPKEAARGVLAGRVPYVLIDEGGVTNFKPMHMFSAVNVNKNREKRLDEYLNGGLRSREASSDRSVDSTTERKYLQQAKSNLHEGDEANFNTSAEVVDDDGGDEVRSLHSEEVLRPVYVKAKMHNERPIPMVRPPSPPKEETPPPPPTPPAEEPQPEPEVTPPVPEEADDTKEKLPMLICGNGVSSVYPKEATRDVLCGKVDYYLVDDRGITLFRRKHILAALKLNKDRMERYEDFPCIGGHERVLDRKPVERQGLGYRRRFLDPELIRKGIYVSSLGI